MEEEKCIPTIWAALLSVISPPLTVAVVKQLLTFYLSDSMDMFLN